MVAAKRFAVAHDPGGEPAHAGRTAPTGGSAGAARDAARNAQAVWDALGTIADPEIPVISIVDLGIVRSVELAPDGAVEVGIAPTYSGCPATEVIRGLVAATLAESGFESVRLREVLSPPWTSDWITPNGRAQLLEYGIAPPAAAVTRPRHLVKALSVACPRCQSTDTETVSEFGSTPCKSLRRCRACREPFEYFKCI